MKPTSPWATIRLYRSIWRLLTSLSHIKPASTPLMSPNPTAAVKIELQRYNANPTRYIQYFKSELQREVSIEFRKPLVSSDVEYNRVKIANSLHSVLQKMIQENDLVIGLGTLIELREKNRQRVIWKLAKRKYQDDIKHLEYEKMSNKKKRVLASKRHKDEAEFLSINAMQRFLKQLQTMHKIPNPFLLPYTKTKNTPIESLVQSSIAIPGSVKETTLKEAYDWPYLETVVKPSIEYDINRNYHLTKFHNTITNKGPVNVKLGFTVAAPKPLPFLQYPNVKLKDKIKLALEVRNMVRLDRMIQLWNSTGNSNEQQNPNGSYTIKTDCKYEQTFFPKNHYQKLAYWEGIWEASFQGESPEMHVQSWMVDIEETSKYLQEKMRPYEAKTELLKDKKSDLYKQQKLIQKQQNEYFNQRLNDYQNLINTLEINQVCKHSELVNKDINHYGHGKTLYDYLKQYNVRAFKFGDKYDRNYRNIDL